MGEHRELDGLDRLGIGDTIATRLAGWARVDPDRPAIEDADGVVTYAELDREVGAVAGWLAHEARPDRPTSPGADPSPIGVLADRARSLVVASMAIARAGLVSAAIDPSYPAERRAALVADAGIGLVLTDRGDGPSGAVDLGDCTGAPIGQVAVEPGRPSSILYTSGSTGTPKGVVYSHAARLTLSASLPIDTSGPGTRCGVVHGGSSGGAEGVVCIPLVMGGTLVPYDVDERGLGDLVGWLRTRRTTSLRTVPTVLRQLADGLAPGQRFDDLVSVALFGEQLHWADIPRLRRALGPGAVIHNTYGSSEAGIVASFPVGPDDPVGHGPVPVGRTVAGRSLVVDGDELVAIGEEVEVPGSYWRRPGLTRERFDLDADGRRTCRTGDRGRFDADGNLHLDGRIDEVVKIGGVRVDLGEVEGALIELDGVTAAAAIVRTDRHGDLRLHAFVTTDDPTLGPQDLRASLAPRLPRPMRPDTVTVLDALPRLPSGKVDRSALTERRANHDPASPGTANHDPVDHDPAAGAAVEPRLATIWAAAVDQPQAEIGLDDDFFDLGGDSLRAVRMFTEIERRLDVDLPVATLLRAPTLRLLDTVVREALVDDGRDRRRVGGRWSCVVEIRGPGPTGRRRPALIVLHDGMGQILGARRLAEHLAADQPIYALTPPELSGRPTPPRTLEDVAADYLSQLLDVAPLEPWVLFGHSFGGTLAFEIGRQAEQSGHERSLIVLGDSVAPGRPSPWARHGSISAGRIVARRRQETEGLPWPQRARQAIRGAARLAEGTARRQVRRARSGWSSLRVRVVVARRRTVPLDLREQLITDRCISMAARYAAQPYPGPVVLVTSRNGDPGSAAVWAELAGTFRQVGVAQDHHDMLREPGVRAVAAILATEIDRLTAAGTDGPSGEPVGAAAGPGVVTRSGRQREARPGVAVDRAIDGDAAHQRHPTAPVGVDRDGLDLG